MKRATAFLLLCPAPAIFAAGLDVETAKQILDAKWQKVKPEAAERTVLFQAVRATGESAGNFMFTVTAVVRDYEKGYPPNRYYGRTCLSTFTNQPYTIVNRAGNWDVNGALTPLEFAKCTPNPSDGVSSVPLASLPGKQAGKGAVGAAPAAVRSGGAVIGNYVCWNFNRAQLLLQLTIQAGNKYMDSAGKPGTFAIDASGRMTFRGGIWEGGLPPDTHPIYYEPQGVPTISVRNARNEEVVFCQKN